MNINIAKKEIIHFIGIGGIGMSGLALIMKGQGFNVQGSDINNNKNIDRLKKDKIKIYLNQSKKNLKNATMTVVSSAIKKTNPEIVEAKRKKIPIIKRGAMLASIVSLMKNIVVVGSHGKTTTTSLITSEDVMPIEEPMVESLSPSSLNPIHRLLGLLVLKPTLVRLVPDALLVTEGSRDEVVLS